MGHRSYLFTPDRMFGYDGVIPITWFFIFEERDFYLEKKQIGFKTTVKKAKKVFLKKISTVRSPYLQKIFKHLSPLKDSLYMSSPSGEVSLDCNSYAESYRNLNEAAKKIREMPSDLDRMVSKKTYKRFQEYFEQTSGEILFKMTGNYTKDKKFYEKHEVTIEDTLLGWEEK